jgi:hypothetical protein
MQYVHVYTRAYNNRCARLSAQLKLFAIMAWHSTLGASWQLPNNRVVLIFSAITKLCFLPFIRAHVMLVSVIWGLRCPVISLSYNDLIRLI